MKFSESFEKELAEQQFTEEQLLWLEKRYAKKVMELNGYKIKINEKSICYRSEYKGNVFFKLLLEKNDFEGNKVKAYKNIKFANCETPKMEKSEIIIEKMFEDFYFKPGDKYNPQFTLVITSYRYANENIASNYLEISKYKDNINNFENENFEIIGEPVNIINEEDLPF